MFGDKMLAKNKMYANVSAFSEEKKKQIHCKNFETIYRDPRKRSQN